MLLSGLFASYDMPPTPLAGGPAVERRRRSSEIQETTEVLEEN